MKLICVKNLLTKEVIRIDGNVAYDLVVNKKTHAYVSKSKYKSFLKQAS